MTRLRERAVLTVVCAVAIGAAAGCSDDGTTSESSTTSPSTVDEDQAYDEAKQLEERFFDLDANEPLPSDASWVTDSFRRARNEEITSLEEEGVTRKGSVTVNSTHLADSDPDAASGWDLSVWVCSTSTQRLYDEDGNDVSADPADPTKPLPAGPRDNVHIMRFTSPDDGDTWRLDKVQLVPSTNKETPCAS